MKTILAILIQLFLPIYLVSQEALSKFNNLPSTNTVRAPEFDVVRKYSMSFDKNMNLLLIKEFNFGSETNLPHSIQRMYEIPTVSLSLSSFMVEIDEASNEINIRILLNNTQPQLHEYWMHNTEVVSILNRSNLYLGPWKYSKELEKSLSEIVNQIGEYYAKASTIESSLQGTKKSVYKYGSERATLIGEKDLDGKLNGEYYFPYSITDPPQFQNYKNLTLAEKAIKKSIVKQMGTRSGELSGIPIFIYLDQNGKVESIFIGSDILSEFNEIINLDEFQNGGKNEAEEVKCKFIILI